MAVFAADTPRNPLWTVVFPALALLAISAVFNHWLDASLLLVDAFLLVILCGAVFSAVHHAEVLAARVGEPFGSILLAVAVTTIEVGLIFALMLSAPDGGGAIARDTVYAAVMIVLSCVIGLCLVAGGTRHFEQTVGIYGTASYLAVLATLAVISLILPNETVTMLGPYYNTAQLIVVAIVSLVLYGAFLFTHTVRHRDYFLPALQSVPGAAPSPHAIPSAALTMASATLLVVSLTGVVLLAKSMSPTLTRLITGASLPIDFAGVVIAGLVLLPEGIAAVRASRANQLQTGLNLALGSSLASIGITIPIVSVYAAFVNSDLELGVSPSKTVLLVLAIFVSGITLGTGRTTVLHGIVHLAIFAIYLLLAAVP